ncbi:MAG: hypothetical protein AB7S80_03450 [Rhizobiaceae bacterium]
MPIQWHKPEEPPLAAELIKIIRPDQKKKAQPAPKAKRERRSDLMVAALGITLGLICALFPWYIFFNQDQFGPPAVTFSGEGTSGASGPITIGPQKERVGAPMAAEELPDLQLDLFATGTLQHDEDAEAPPSVLEQPFPAGAPVFRIIHVENGRAMVEDETGMWVVQRGSTLPDNSRVASIEQRGGHWVVVTNDERVLEVSP